ncbi:MAG: hypothetical protein WCQ49_01930 [Candidatus Saccharibacteria bacterium]
MKLFNKKSSDIPRRRLTVDSQVETELSGSYRRNQTLPGFTASQSSVRVKTHHLSIKRRKVMAGLGIVLLSAAILWLLISNFTARVLIVSSDVSSSDQFDKKIYEKVIQEYLDINPTARFRFFLDQSSLSKYVVNKLPEVGTVKQQNMVFAGETSFDIKMRKPLASWLINGKQHFVDSDGMSFDRNYFEAPTVQIVDNSGASVQSGSAIVSQRFLSFVGLVISRSANSGYTVSQAILPVDKTRELDVRIKEGDYLVKLSIDRPAGEQVEDMAAAIKYFDSKQIKPEYIDVRVSGKAFYK